MTRISVVLDTRQFIENHNIWYIIHIFWKLLNVWLRTTLKVKPEVQKLWTT